MEKPGMEKSAEAFRTISEVADILDTPAHVLRFWESRFSQVRPVKRAGGRRYYRPADLALLGGIRKLLHEDGMTIRGVQKILREKGVRHVATLASGGTAAPGAAPAPAAGTVAGTAAPVSPFAGPVRAAFPAHAPAPASAPASAPAPASIADDAGHWPAAPAPVAAAADDRLLPDPDDAAQDEAPMELDAPTLPLGQPGNVRPLPGGAPAAGAAPAAPPPAEPRPPAAALLRAMDAVRAREHGAELRAVYTRLSALRDRLAAGGAPARD